MPLRRLDCPVLVRGLGITPVGMAGEHVQQLHQLELRNQLRGGRVAAQLVHRQPQDSHLASVTAIDIAV